MSGNSIIVGSSSGNLNFKTAQKIIHKLLTCERIKTSLDEGKILNLKVKKPEIRVNAYTKGELAEKLGITIEEFEKLKLPYFYKSIASKVSLPLICLYCATKFIEQVWF